MLKVAEPNKAATSEVSNAYAAGLAESVDSLSYSINKSASIADSGLKLRITLCMCFLTPVSPKLKSGLLYLPNIAVPSKVLPFSCLCTYPEKSPCITLTSPSTTRASVAEVLLHVFQRTQIYLLF